MIRHPHTLKLLPSEIEMTLPDGASLRQALEPRGLEFPCGGRGHCQGCRVRIVEGALRATELDEKVLTHAELAAGWRLACRHQVTADVALQVAQWETPLPNAVPGTPQPPREDLGIAIDLGTTTLAAQLVDLKTGQVLAVNCAVNPQARHGLDALSRVAYALEGGQRELQRQVREQLSHVVFNLQHGGRTPQPVGQVLIAANTIMHHLFCGVDLAPLAENPFLPLNAAGFRFNGTELGWSISERAVVEVLPCLSGLAGGDTLAAIHACGMAERPELTALVDFGTSVEIVLGHRDRLLATTLDLGPIFEAGGVTGGMRAAPGAIAQAEARPNFIESYVIGGGLPHGICGSGLVDTIAAGLQLHWVSTDGRLPMHSSLPLTGHFSVSAADVQTVLHARATIVAALRVVAAKFGQPLENVRALYVAGAYGNCPSYDGTQRLGLLPVPPERIQHVGDAALRGTRQLLVAPSAQPDAIRRRLEYVDLCGDTEMEAARVAEMKFR